MPPAEAAHWAPTHRTVLILDEAGMVSTFDVDALTAHAERAGAKVLLVGDPAQIGVVNGPGKLLATLADRHGAARLDQIHRFTEDWEREASLRLRDGDPAALDDYAATGRIHPAADTETAVDAVFAQWSAARATGADTLMMAHSRADVDQLNARARAAAVAAGDVRGDVVDLGGRAWQAGDHLLARRNDRRLAVGDGHVRNGDRYRVLDARQDGVLVQRLDRPQTALLPTAYVAQHADYGWASTIDGAQGATTDVGILLVRPGLDREHLYVGLTRGRHANHGHVAPDSGDVVERHGSQRAGAPDASVAAAVLQAALARTGAQQTAHHVRDRARAAAAPERQTVPVSPAALTPDVLSAAHERRLEELHDRQRERAALGDRSEQLRRAQARLGEDVAAIPWWRRSRRNQLVGQQRHAEEALVGVTARCIDLDREIRGLERTAETEAHQRAEQARSCRGQTPRTTSPLPAVDSSALDVLLARIEARVRRRERADIPVAPVLTQPPTVTQPRRPRIRR
jgi:hypothetical protein